MATTKVPAAAFLSFVFSLVSGRVEAIGCERVVYVFKGRRCIGVAVRPPRLFLFVVCNVEKALSLSLLDAAVARTALSKSNQPRVLQVLSLPESCIYSRDRSDETSSIRACRKAM